MRSKKTTNILLLLAFLFILIIIILCLIPTHKEPGDTPFREGLGGDEPRRRTSGTSTKPTTQTTVATKVTTSAPTEPVTVTTKQTTVTTMEPSIPSTMEEEEVYEEPTTPTEKTTTVKHSPPPSVKEEISSSSTPSSTTSSPTIHPIHIENTTTQHSTHKVTEPYDETSTLHESSTEPSYGQPENATANYTSTLITTPATTLTTTTLPTTILAKTNITDTSTTTTTATTTTSPTTSSTTTTTTTTTTATTTTIPTTTTTIPTITTTTPTTTTTIPTTTPYDHKFTLYTEPEDVCTSDGCKDISGKMLDSLDHEIDPCENFHEYSCGGVHKDEFLRPENAEETLDEILKEQLLAHETHASKFYDSCLSYLDGTENLEHEEIFPQDMKVDFPKSEYTDWPSKQLTNTISSLIKRDLPILFDVTVDVKKLNFTIKILPKLKISLFDDYKDHYDHKYCIDQFDRRMLKLINEVIEEVPPVMVSHLEKREKSDGGEGKPENHTDAKVDKQQMNSTNEEEIIDVDIEAEYQRYLECMNTTGIELRINRLESVLMTSDLFAKGLKPVDQKSQLSKVHAFLSDLNGILLTSTVKDGTGTPVDVITLGELVGNTVLGGLIKFDSLLESLHGYKLDESQEIVVEDLNKFSRIFSYLKNTWSDRNLENVLLMLAGEKLFKKGEDREYKKNFCFKITKKYFPLDMQLLFTKSFAEEDIDVLVSEIFNLGSSLAAEIPKITQSYYKVPTQVEFIDKKTLKSNMEQLKSQLVLSGHFIDDLHILQTLYRNEMYNMTGKELEDSESCRSLPRDVQVACNLHLERIIVPLEQLVPPNFYFRKDMPNYLRLEGVTYYYMKMIALLEVHEINLKGYKENDCLIQNIPTNFEERNSKLKIKYQTYFTEEMKSETLMEFQLFNVAWQVIKTLMSNSSGLKPNETKELPLIWLGEKSLHPLKAFLIRKAQESCNENKNFDLMRISRFKSPPKSFWINSLVKIDSLFGGAWHCPENTLMAETRECPPVRTTSEWVDPYATTSSPIPKL